MAGAQHDIVRVKVPGRIDFAGGWSDVHFFSEREGGAVVNAAVSPFVEGSAQWRERRLHLEYTLDLPPGSHLGSSASIDVAWLALVNGLTGHQQTPMERAEAAYQLEKILGVTGGKQDQYAAALGGFSYLRFSAENKPASIEQLAVSDQTIAALTERCILCYSGLPEGAGDIHRRVWERYRGGDETIALALRELRDSAAPARDALLSGNLDALATILNVNREATRRLDEGVITPRMDGFLHAAQDAGATGAKPLGEGGGGCLLFLCAEGGRPRVVDALEAMGGEIIPFQFAPSGS